MSGPQLDPLGHAITGALGAVIVNTLTYPLDTVKTRIQAGSQSKLPPVEVKGASDATPAGTKKRRWSKLWMNTLIYKAYRLLVDEGFGSAYAGLSASLSQTYALQFFYFLAYRFLRERILARRGASKGTISIGTELLLGAAAGAVAQIITLPTSVVSTQQQVCKEDNGDRLSAMAITRRILRDRGVLGLWSGLGPTLTLCINPALTYGSYQWFRGLLVGEGNALSPLMNLGLGASAKAFATVITYPYIMAKVRMMSSIEMTGGTMAFLSSTGREHGLAGLYKGMSMQIGKSALTQALLFMIKDELAKWYLVVFLAMKRVYGRRRSGMRG